EMITTRKQRGSNMIILEDIKIAGDGEAMHLLGAFIGNRVENTSVWTPTLEAITRELKRWGLGKPTMKGRCLIVNMVVGGHTQYRAQVQGMPKPIKDQLTRMI
ncbi:hypothetical protein J132_00082, partial [Termitomyces sp. J132]